MPTTDRVQKATFALQMAEFAEKIGRRMRERREELKATDPRWTQDYTARQIRDDLTGTQYARWERGEVMPRQETLERIAEVLNIPLGDLFQGKPYEPAASPDHVTEMFSEIRDKLDEALASAGPGAAVPVPEIREAVRAARADTDPSEVLREMLGHLEDMNEAAEILGVFAERDRYLVVSREALEQLLARLTSPAEGAEAALKREAEGELRAQEERLAAERRRAARGTGTDG